MTKKQIDILRENTFNAEKALKLFIEQNNRLEKPLETKYEFLKWLDEGRLIVIGGASGIGKTALLLELLYELALKNQDTISIYANSEMMIQELMMRLIVNQIEDFNMSNIRKSFKNNNKNFKNNLDLCQFMLPIKNFFFVNTSQFDLKNIIEMIKLAREKNPDKKIFIGIDYLQLLLLDQDNLTGINRIIKELKDCLKENKANAFVISALNRDAIRNNFVDMSAFKDSSIIEYTSDIAVLMCFKTTTKKEKVFYTLKQPDEQHEKDIIDFCFKCVKNRFGKFFNYSMLFDKLNQKFYFEDEKEYIKTKEPETYNSPYELL